MRSLGSSLYSSTIIIKLCPSNNKFQIYREHLTLEVWAVFSLRRGCDAAEELAYDNIRPLHILAGRVQAGQCE